MSLALRVIFSGRTTEQHVIIIRCCLVGHVERKDDNDWVKRCITWAVEGIRQKGRPQKTWWDCVKNDVESLGLSQKDVQSMNKWRRRIKGATG